MDLGELGVIFFLALGVLIGAGGYIHPQIPTVVGWVAFALCIVVFVWELYESRDFGEALFMMLIGAAFICVPYGIIAGLKNVPWPSVTIAW